MTLTMFGRKLIVTSLDPVPRLLRSNAVAVAVNPGELEKLRANDGPTFRRIIGEIYGNEANWDLVKDVEGEV